MAAPAEFVLHPGSAIGERCGWDKLYGGTQSRCRDVGDQFSDETAEEAVAARGEEMRMDHLANIASGGGRFHYMM